MIAVVVDTSLRLLSFPSLICLQVNDVFEKQKTYADALLVMFKPIA